MIIAENVTVSFRRAFGRRLKALDGLSLGIREGDAFALLGPNGAGKSTAMYCLMGLIKPDSGTVSVFGKRPYPGAEIFKDIAYLPEEPHYHQYLTVEECVAYYASLYGRKIPRKKVREAIESVGLTEFRDLKVKKCSKGMKQKMGIAQCLVASPKILFLDEPTRGLDPLFSKLLREVLVGLNADGVTIVINSHVLSEVEMICNRAAIINRGKVLVEDDLSALQKLEERIYSVEFTCNRSIPEYVQVTARGRETVKGEMPAERLEDFFEYVRSEGLKVYECSLKKNTLESAFLDILSGEA